MNAAILFFLLTMSSAFAGDPQFDPTTLMKLVLVPADAAVGSVIYRLRANDVDFDYPLQFELLDEAAKTTIKVETLPCSRYNSVCQANVVLQRRLEPGRYHDFRVRVRDTKGGSSTISCTLTATNATTPKDVIWPHVPDLIMIPEDAKRGTELGYVIAKKNPHFSKPAFLELWGSPLFAIRQRAVSDENTEGTIFLLGPLDFEKQAMYHLTILANDAYIIPKQDTRNIAGVQIVIVVQDVQDMPPVFTLAPPVTKLDNALVPGDIVVKVHAEDGDKGSPRAIQYGLVSEGNPFTPFFNISEKGGEIILVRPLDEITAISHPGVPILLTVVAEEVKMTRDGPPAMSSTVQVALILGERGNKPPYFESENYVSRIDENALQGTALVFSDPYVPQVNDDDMGKNGVFSLTLENNNGTFEISPNVGERRANFIVKVRDNTYLDYEERGSVQFRIVAQELGPTSNLSTSVEVVVFINDMNDNNPIFSQETYNVLLPENMTASTRVTQVQAEDIDTGIYGKIRYTQILGYLNTSLNLDPVTGIISVLTDNHGFDREVQETFRLYVEARDEDGQGNRATVPLLIKLMDINDNPPIFDRTLYEFILAPDLKNFTSPAIIHAVDNDAESPNNVVRYEIIHGNYEDKFAINPITGEVFLKAPLIRVAMRRRSKRESTSEGSEVYILTARAYDLGVPHFSTTCEIRIYPPESRARTMVFIVAGKNPDRRKTEEMLSTITGARVVIQEIRPYNGKEIEATDVSVGHNGKDRSVVVASVIYNNDAIVDVSHLQQSVYNKTTMIIHADEENVREYRADNSLLFWLLILLAFLILSLLILVLCCLCQGCPLYMPLKRIIHTNSVSENVHLVHKEKGPGHENKSVQAVEWSGRGVRKEAWSADLADSRTKPTQWQFNKRNQKQKEAIINTTLQDYDDNGSLKDIRAVDEKSTLRLRDGPNVIYSREWQRRQQANYENKDMYIEDMDGDYTSVSRLGQREIHKNQEDIDGESLRRHELERGSDAEYRSSQRRSLRRQQAQTDDEDPQRQVPPGQLDGRDQLFIKDGNTEILRLITRGRPADVVQALQNQSQPITLLQAPQPHYIMVDSGKDILMQRFIEQQQLFQQPQQMQQKSAQTNENIQRSAAPSLIAQSDPAPIHVTPSQPKDPTATTPNLLQQQELLESSLRQQNELLRQILLEKERQEELRFDTQSLPAQVVTATQTDRDTATQTDDLQDLRPDRRRVRSDNDESFSENEDSYDIYVIGRGANKDSIKWLKQKKSYKKRRSKTSEVNANRIIKVVEEVKRKIKTPIMEESESPEAHKQNTQIKEGKTTPKLKDKINKSSVLKKEVLLEIAGTLESKTTAERRAKLEQMKNLSAAFCDSESDDADVYMKKVGKKFVDAFSDDSLESPPNELCDSAKTKNRVPSKSSAPTSKKDKRNLVFSRQGSSTDARDAASEADNKSLKKRLSTSFEKDEDRRIRKSMSATTLKSKEIEDKKVDVSKSVPRYMQWYKNKKERDKKSSSGKAGTGTETGSSSADKSKSAIKKLAKTPKNNDPAQQQRITKLSDKDLKDKIKNDVKPTLASTIVVPNGTDVGRPLLQHSEHRYEHNYPYPALMYAQSGNLKPQSIPASILIQPDEKKNLDNTLKVNPGNVPGLGEDDYDSGIAMASLIQGALKKPPITEKKSVFTIAYDDMHTKQLSGTPPPY